MGTEKQDVVCFHSSALAFFVFDVEQSLPPQQLKSRNSLEVSKAL